MFGGEVADVAVGYVIGLARQLFVIDRGIRAGEWPKPAGMSLAGKRVALVGFGDIGRCVAKRWPRSPCRSSLPTPASKALGPSREPCLRLGRRPRGRGFY